MVDATDTKGLLATSILLLTKILRIGEGSLVIGAARTGGCQFKAGCCSASGKACAGGKVVLRWFCAVKASLLAPSKEASSLAIFEAIIGSGIVALAAGSR